MNFKQYIYKKLHIKKIPSIVPFLGFYAFMTIGMQLIFWFITNPEPLDIASLNAASRMSNSLFGAIITFMALIITLTSNLYTPGLVKVFVRHPVIIIGISFIVLTNILVTLTGLIPNDHDLYIWVFNTTFITSFITLTSIIPYLFYLTQFLRPSYFVPRLLILALKSHDKLQKNKRLNKNFNVLFDTIDILSNISNTASTRDDRKLMRLVCQMLHKAIYHLIKHAGDRNKNWRKGQVRFIPGHDQNVKNYLVKNHIWPEAYLFGKLIQILKSVNENQDEVIGEACENLIQTFELALAKDDTLIMEMHLMIMNRLADIAIEKKDFEQIQIISQYSLQIINFLLKYPQQLDLAFQSWIHFANLAFEKKIHFAYETYLYDSGMLLLNFSNIDEVFCIEFYNDYMKQYWNNAIHDGAMHKTITFRVIVKTYWEARAQNHTELANILMEDYLVDSKLHLKTLKQLTKYKTPLHWSFSERLLRFNYLAPEVRAMAQSFMDAKSDEDSV
jgi:hypothetical protein